MPARSFGVLAFVVAVLLALGAAPSLAAPEHRLALVIGNTRYAGADELVNPANDARDMCAALKRLGFETLCHHDVRTRKEFLDRLDDLANRLKPSSRGLFFYAGHAVQIGGENYLVPIQAAVQSMDDVPKLLVPLHLILGRRTTSSTCAPRAGSALRRAALPTCQDPSARTRTARTANACTRWPHPVGHCDPRVASICAPTASATCSHQAFATTCTPIGRPSGDVPARTTTHGQPVRL